MEKNTHTVLSLRQWGLITKALTPADSANPAASYTSAIEGFELCSISAFMGISFGIADPSKSVLGNTEVPKPPGSCSEALWRKVALLLLPSTAVRASSNDGPLGF